MAENLLLAFIGNNKTITRLKNLWHNYATVGVDRVAGTGGNAKANEEARKSFVIINSSSFIFLGLGMLSAMAVLLLGITIPEYRLNGKWHELLVYLAVITTYCLLIIGSYIIHRRTAKTLLWTIFGTAINLAYIFILERLTGPRLGIQYFALPFAFLVTSY